MEQERVHLAPYPGTSAYFDGRTLTVKTWESSLPEVQHPWFEVNEDGKTWKGQATEPATRYEDGRVQYRVEMERVD